MNQKRISDNNVNEAGSCACVGPSFGRCPMDEQRRPFNKIVMECYYEGEPERRDSRKKMKTSMDEKGLFEVSTQRLSGQIRVIKTNEYLSTVELGEIRRKVKNRNYEEIQADEQTTRQ